MKRDDILNMPAGRDMDALIAEKVMGWKYSARLLVPPDNHPARTNNWCAEWDEAGRPNWLPHYSTDISAAWEVVEKLAKIPFVWNIESLNIIENGKCAIQWRACLWGDDDKDLIVEYSADTETLPLATCRAALLSVMGD